MMSVTRPRARSALVSGVALLVLAGAAACDRGDDIGQGDSKDGSTSSSGDQGTDTPAVETEMTVDHGVLDPTHEAKVVEGVTGAIDPWFDEAFLGDFPRSDFSGAFVAFTQDAAADAQQRDLDLLTNAGISDQIDTATATNRRVRLDVFAPDGHPRGVTANFVLDFDTTGDLEQHLRVHGALYLAKDKGEWKVFGYSVDEAVKI